MDLLLGDLGLIVHKKSGWLAESTETYGPDDLQKLGGGVECTVFVLSVELV